MAPAHRTALVDLLRLVLLCVLVGIVAGVVWYLVAPTPAFVVSNGQLIYRKELPGEYVAMDGWFATIGAVAGLLVALVVLRRGPLGVWRVVAVPVVGVLGSCVAWGVGHALGPNALTPKSAAGHAANTVLHGPLTLNAKGVLLVWPVVSLAVLTLVLAWHSRDDRRAPAPPVDAELAGDDDPALVGGLHDLGDVDRG